MQMPFGFFIIEAKLFDPLNHVPQAVCEMYMCGQLLGLHFQFATCLRKKSSLVLWPTDMTGFFFSSSSIMTIMEPPISNLVWCSLIHAESQWQVGDPWAMAWFDCCYFVTLGEFGANICDWVVDWLGYWIENSFVDLGSDDWFEPVWVMLCCASVQCLVCIQNSISENFALWLSPSYANNQEP